MQWKTFKSGRQGKMTHDRIQIEERQQSTKGINRINEEY